MGPSGASALSTPDRGARPFVWGVWALTLLAALAFVGRYASNVPFYDDWNLVPVLAGDRPVSAGWLWSAHNDTHRIPLPRLILLALDRLAGHDFRAGMYFSVLALGALSFAMTWVAERVRGRPACADAFFPLVLLHWGHYENFLWSWQVQFVTSTVLAGILLLFLVAGVSRLGPGAALLAGACLILLPMCGMNGLALVPALALALGYTGFVCWRSSGGRGRRTALVLWGSALAALLVVARSFVHIGEPGRRWANLDPWRSLETAAQVLAGGFGPAAGPLWPLSGVVVLGLLAAGAAVVAFAAWRGPPAERPRALGLLAFLAAVGCLALFLGVGRTGYGFTSRYAVLAAPALCGAYFVWVLYGPPAAGRLVPVALFTLAAIAFAFNLEEGRGHGRTRRDAVAAFERDLLAGEPIHKLLARHAPALCPHPAGEGASFHDWLEDGMRGLHRAGIGIFRHLRPESPRFREVPLPLAAAVPAETGPGGTTDSHLPLPLPEPAYVGGVRIKYVTHGYGPGMPPFLQVFWRRSDQDEFTSARRYIQNWRWQNGKLLPEEQTLTIWICDTIDQLRIHPAGEPGVFSLSEVMLLVPPADE